MEYKWIEWIKKLQAIAQNGLAYSENAYDLERYEQLQQIIADILQHHTNHDADTINDFLTREEGYLTPKVDVRGVVFRDNKILLVKERSDGKWTLPGGWADVCYSPGENVVREIYEESGYETRPVKVLAIHDRDKQSHVPPFPYHVYKIFFQCKLVGGSPKSGIETENVDFFRENEIPELSLSRVTPGQISTMFEYHRDDKMQTAFD